jgi:hypothetical protein
MCNSSPCNCSSSHTTLLWIALETRDHFDEENVVPTVTLGGRLPWRHAFSLLFLSRPSQPLRDLSLHPRFPAQTHHPHSTLDRFLEDPSGSTKSFSSFLVHECLAPKKNCLRLATPGQWKEVSQSCLALASQIPSSSDLILQQKKFEGGSSSYQKAKSISSTPGMTRRSYMEVVRDGYAGRRCARPAIPSSAEGQRRWKVQFAPNLFVLCFDSSHPPCSVGRVLG